MINRIKNAYIKNEEIINYIIVGGLTTLISLLSYYICVFIFLDPNNALKLQIANIISWILSVSFAYFSNRKYVFKSKEKNKFKELIKFVGSRLSTLVIDMLCMFTFVTVFAINDKFSKIIVQIIIFILNYLLSKFLVFKNKNEKKNKYLHYKYTIIIMLFTFIFSILIPYGGDDWGNYLNGSTNILGIINTVKSFYMLWEGRIVSRFLCLLIIPNSVLFAFINSIVFGLFYYFLTKILNADKRPFLYPLIFISLVFIDMEAYSQIYIWKTGNITYFIPTVFLFFLIFKRLNIFENKEISKSKFEFLIIPLCFFFSLFVENITVGIITVLLMNIILYYFNKRKVDKIMLSCLIVSIIGFIIMMSSPGNFNRLSMDVDFNNLSIIGKILYNIPNLVEYTYIKNSFLLFLILIILTIYIYKTKINIFLKIILYLFILAVPIITIVIYNLNIFVKLPNILLLVLDKSKFYVCLYWVIFTFIFLIILLKISLKKNFKRNIYFIILALIGNGSMLLSPVWGGRTASLTSFSLIVLCLFVLVDYKVISSKLLLPFKIIMYLFIVFFTLYSIYIFILNTYRENYIKYQIKNNNSKYDSYDIIILPSYFTWNLNTWGSDGEFAYNFKESYSIEKEAELKYVKIRNIDLSVLK